jgi:dipeptidyl aminopeptidase/acylaminoacyl peptidase
VNPENLSYQMPPKALADLIDAPSTPTVSLSPDRTWMLLLERPSLPPIAEIAQPELRLAGLRINPRTNGRARTSYFTKLTLQHIGDLSQREITELPTNVRINYVNWSPDSQHLAFTTTSETGISLWIAEIATGEARCLSADLKLNAVLGNPCEWFSDSQHLLCVAIPKDRGLPPTEPLVPLGPTVQENLGKKTPARTYQDLLKSPYDEKLLSHYLSAEIVVFALDGKQTNLGHAGILSRVEASPNSQFIFVETIHPPFSYLVPLDRFPRRIEVLDRQGKLVREIADLPLADGIPVAFDAVRTGPRGFGWRSDADATLIWAEAQDGGDPGVEMEIRDILYTLAAPFDGEAKKLVALALRSRGILWGNSTLALVTEACWKDRTERLWSIDPSAPEKMPFLLFEGSSEDRYNDHGSPMMHITPAGTYVLLTTDQGRKVYLRGEGASPEGDRPFLDELDLTTGKTNRLWRSEAPYYEIPIDVLRPGLILTRRETQTEPPNYLLRDLEKQTIQPLTTFLNPFMALVGIQKEQIRYMRNDGIELTATLYLPADYNVEQGTLPLLMWAYPTEFKQADAAAQVTDSPHRFVRVSWGSPLLMLAHGYAVLDNPTMPIVGDEPNDTYIEQLVASAQAAVEEVVRRGVADLEHIGIGGHSYGAFMTANLLAHSNLFRAGIARSGAYNRTLTPFGFQAEERTIWDAPKTYMEMSPFMFAHLIKHPLLLIHGEADNNSGTFPMQSERFYSALKGNGATVRFVLLPHESHGYQARESVMHMLWEMASWLDTYLR